MIPIIYSNEDLMIVEKPSGIPTLRGDISPSFAEILEKEYPSQKEIEDSGITHRLDNDVSGILLIAKTKSSYKKIRQMFANKEIIKEYTILVHGYIKKDGSIATGIDNKKSSKKVSILNDNINSLTSFESLGHFLYKSDNNYLPCSLVLAKSNSGRRHQIRVHFLSVGHPIISDPLYDKKNKNIFKRIFFHASGLNFKWNDKNVSVKSDLPKDLAKIKKNLMKRV